VLSFGVAGVLHRGCYLDRRTDLHILGSERRRDDGGFG
jgi:hypothetical protein